MNPSVIYMYFNRPFPGYFKSLFKNEAKCKAIDMKMMYLFLLQMKLIISRKVLHLASF